MNKAPPLEQRVNLPVLAELDTGTLERQGFTGCSADQELLGQRQIYPSIY